MSEWDTAFVRRHMSVDGIGAPSEANRNRFDRWLAEHDREVAVEAIAGFLAKIQAEEDSLGSLLARFLDGLTWEETGPEMARLIIQAITQTEERQEG